MSFKFNRARASSLQITTVNTVTVAICKRQLFRFGKHWSKKDKVLLLQRAENPYNVPGYKDRFAFFWELLGGEVDSTDISIESALEREVEEEAKLRLKSFELVGNSPYTARPRENRSVQVPATNWIYAGRANFFTWVRHSKEHVAHKWLTLEEALQMELAAKHSQILVEICLINGDEELRNLASSLTA